MTVDTKYKSGKSERDENFPVASRFVAPRFRAPILAFYRFARAADDAADNPKLDATSKLAILSALEDTLLGRSDAAGDAVPLRAELRARNLTAQHALDLLKAFRQDVAKSRYNTWSELIEYCRYSAMPVGRFVLDVHGEARSTWEASDALCTALQIINHLQDCAKDNRDLDRVYIPLEDLAKHGTEVAALARPKASPQLLACLHSLADRTAGLLPEASLLPRNVADLRLSVETSVIVALARKLLARLKTRDPLTDRVHLSKPYAASIAARAAAAALVGRAAGKRGSYEIVKDDAA
ncbi:MAG TPA: squalene synthase HpnC [Hyphomicrobium sp.]|uniref:squalene synthase HpnC n=1 Tax=Hyphomicrobium sp. TaxID=82 RepID=UPI002B51BBB7|nr:squalene synthase HpnC [Hyphomicrobium sp.]HXE00560.1 squalene synthase HpnC [Hyphomicrobium sp.]